MGNTDFLLAACKAILSCEPNDLESTGIYLLACASKASELNHPQILQHQELFLQEATEASARFSHNYITMLRLEALSLLNKNEEVREVFLANPSQITLLLPWLLTAQVAACLVADPTNVKQTSKQFFERFFNSKESLDAYLDEANIPLECKLRLARFFLLSGNIEEARRICLEKLLSREKRIAVDECQAFFNFVNLGLPSAALRLEILEAILLRFPGHGALLLKAAWECSIANAPDRAFAYYKMAEGVALLTGANRFDFAQSCEMLGRLEEALAHYAQLGLLGRIRTSNVLLRMQRYDEAVKVYDEVIQHKPSRYVTQIGRDWSEHANQFSSFSLLTTD